MTEELRLSVTISSSAKEFWYTQKENGAVVNKGLVRWKNLELWIDRECEREI